VDDQVLAQFTIDQEQFIIEIEIASRSAHRTDTVASNAIALTI
jgi:hypothetical protein